MRRTRIQNWKLRKSLLFIFIAKTKNAFKIECSSCLQSIATSQISPQPLDIFTWSNYSFKKWKKHHWTWCSTTRSRNARAPFRRHWFFFSTSPVPFKTYGKVTELLDNTTYISLLWFNTNTHFDDCLYVAAVYFMQVPISQRLFTPV